MCSGATAKLKGFPAMAQTLSIGNPGLFPAELTIMAAVLIVLFMKPLSLFAAALLMTTSSLIAGSIYDIPVKDIDGKETSLKPYSGKVILIVNVASKCGLTPQYKALEA